MSWMSAVQQPLRVFFALGRHVQTDEARYIEDNKAVFLPRFLQEVGFAVQELPARYKSVQFLLATKDAGAKARRKT